MRLDEALRHPIFDASTLRWQTSLDAALNYAKRSWPIFPVHWAENGKCSCGKSDCRSPGKHPLTPNGHKEATTAAHKIRLEWFPRWPKANIATVMGTTGNGYLGI